MNTYSATAASTADPRRRHAKRRRLTPVEARKALSIIGDIYALLPPNLPPSPPASRSSSPEPMPVASSSKRRVDADDQVDTIKRPKVAKPPSASGVPPTQAPVATSQPSLTSATPKVVPNQSSTASTSSVQSSTDSPSTRSLTVHEPVRRPRHGQQSVDFKALQKKVYNQARLFKYSGDARFSSTYAPSDSNYRALKEAPPKDSPYHIHGGCMANLESLEALICFVYAAWCSDHMNGSFSASNWTSIPDFLNWCKRKWLFYVGNRDNAREKAFLGLINMLEAFTNARILRRKHFPNLMKGTQTYVQDVKRELELVKVKQAASEIVRQPMPPPEKSLPSPDTDASATSSPPNMNLNAEPSRPERDDPKKPNGKKMREASPSDVDITVSGAYVEAARKLVASEHAASMNMRLAEKTLSLAITREHFPHTFGRMVCSTLSVEEEYEPDFEDNEGELFWPSQCVTGEGVAWVCLMGRAMVREYGKDLGYKGVEALIPKPGGFTGSTPSVMSSSTS